MEFLLDQLGYLGVLISAFIAGSVIPLSSEAIVAACLAKPGINLVLLLISATIGNVLGGMTCYWMGSKGKDEWVIKYAHVSPEKLARAQRMVSVHGAWFAILAWIPILGSAITVALGYMHANKWAVAFFMTIGKAIRYAVIIWGVDWIVKLF